MITALLVSFLQLTAPALSHDFTRPDPPPCVYLTKPSCFPLLNHDVESGVERGLLLPRLG